MKRELKYYGGDGWGSCHEIGVIEVRHSIGKTEHRKLFTDKEDARDFYESLKYPKACWDLTRSAELIECHTF